MEILKNVLCFLVPTNALQLPRVVGLRPVCVMGRAAGAAGRAAAPKPICSAWEPGTQRAGAGPARSDSGAGPSAGRWLPGAFFDKRRGRGC